MHVLGELLVLALTSFALASIGIFLGSEHFRQHGANATNGERREALVGTSFIRDNYAYEAPDNGEEQEDPDDIVDLQYSPGAEGTLDRDKLLQAGYTNVYTVFKAYMQAQQEGLQHAQDWEREPHEPGVLQHPGHALGATGGDRAAALAVAAVAAAVALRSHTGVQPPAQAAYPLVGGVEGLKATNLLPEFTGELLGNPAACSEHGGTCGSGSDGGSSGASSSGGSLSSVPSCSSAPTSRTASWTALGACGPATPTCTPACRRHVSPAAAHAPAEAAEAALSPSCGRLQHLECCGVAEEPAEGGGGSCAGGHAVAAERVPAVDVYGSSAGIGRRDGVRC